MECISAGLNTKPVCSGAWSLAMCSKSSVHALADRAPFCEGMTMLRPASNENGENPGVDSSMFHQP